MACAPLLQFAIISSRAFYKHSNSPTHNWRINIYSNPSKALICARICSKKNNSMPLVHDNNGNTFLTAK